MTSAAQPIPAVKAPADSSTLEPASPTLSTSPLDSFSSIHAALPSPAQNRRERDDSYGSEADVLAGGEEPQRRHSMDDSDDALVNYKKNLYAYTSSRFDRFKHDLEAKKRSTSPSPPSLSHRSSSQ